MLPLWMMKIILIVSKYKWCAHVRPNGVYVKRGKSKDNEFTYLHTMLEKPEKGKTVDHKDRNPLNNRRYNLRVCTQQQNSYNRVRPKCNRYRGITWHKKLNKWQAQLMISGVQLFLGTFKNDEDAAKAYDRAALINQGEFAVINFPIDHYIWNF